MAAKNDGTPEFKTAIVSIFGESHIDHFGSGFLFRRKEGEPMLIVTAAHVIMQIKAKEKAENQLRMILDCCDSQGKVHVIEAVFSDNKEDEYSYWIHDSYIPEDELFDWCDVAILKVPWEEWMCMVPYVSLIDDMPDSKRNLLCCGFPQSLQPEADKKEALDERPERYTEKQWEKMKVSMFIGSIAELLANSNIVMDDNIDFFGFEYEDRAGHLAREHDAVGGFSGCGLFWKDSNCKNLRVQGLFKKIPYADADFRQGYAVQGRFIKEALLAYCGADDFVFHFDDIIADWRREMACTDEAWADVKKAVSAGDISADAVLKEYKNEDCTLMGCDESVYCKDCYNYWKGQMARYGCFFPSTDDAGKKLTYNLELKEMDGDTEIRKSRRVRAVLLCPNADISDFLGRIRVGEYVIDEDTVFLWNRQDDLYREMRNRKKMPMGMSITRGILDERTAGAIVGERFPESAIVGVGKMMDEVFTADVDADKKRTNLEKLISDVWR